jgi:cell division initiation protein
MHKDDDLSETDEGRRFFDRTASVSPFDMRQRKFDAALRGFDRNQVSSFLADAAMDYESALRDNERLRQEIVRLRQSLTQYRELEGSLQSTLMSARKVADDMHANAVQESERILGDAEARAELSMQNAQVKLETVQREIDGLRLKRREVETSLEATISALRNTLDFVREQDRDRDVNVAPHRPHIVHSA